MDDNINPNQIVGGIEVTSVVWFGASNPVVGIVMGKNTVTGELNVYVGTSGKCVAPFYIEIKDEKDSVKNIIQWGTKVPAEDFVKLMNSIMSQVSLVKRDK